MITDAKGRPVSGWARWCLRADPLPLLLLALVIAFWYFWQYRLPAAAMTAMATYVGLCLGVILFGLLAGGRALQRMLRISCEARLGIAPGAFRSRRRFWPWLIIIAGGTFVTVLAQTPLKMSFAASRPALDHLADQALAHASNAEGPVESWAGLYWISGAEVIGETVVLYVGRNHGDYGFARAPQAGSRDFIFHRPGAEDQPDYFPDFPSSDLGDPAGRRLAGNWFVVYSLHAAASR